MIAYDNVTVFVNGEPFVERAEITYERRHDGHGVVARMTAQLAARQAFMVRWSDYWHWWYIGRGFDGWRFRNGEARHRELGEMRDATRRRDWLAPVDRRHLPKRTRMVVARAIERLRRTQPGGPSVRRCQLDVWRARMASP